MESLISVIVPVYNMEKYLSKCLESILSQSYSNFELLLINDGSTDSSLSICGEYANKDKRIILMSQENSGQCIARNNALDKVSGEYIAFVDSDDEIKPDMFEVMLKAIENTKSDIALCSVSYNSGIRIENKVIYSQQKEFVGEEIIREYITTNHIITAPWNKIYHVSLFSGIRFPDFRANEDACIAHELLGKAKKAVFVKECLYVQNIRDGSTEKSPFSEKNFALIEAAKRKQTYIKENYPKLYNYVVADRVNAIVSLLYKILIYFSYKKNKDAYKKLYNDLLNEYKAVIAQYPDVALPVRTVKAVFHPFIFRLDCYKLGIREITVRFIKKIKKRIVR